MGTKKQVKQLEYVKPFLPLIAIKVIILRGYMLGAGNKLNPTMFEVTDIANTSVCPLAKVMRKELKKKNKHN